MGFRADWRRSVSRVFSVERISKLAFLGILHPAIRRQFEGQELRILDLIGRPGSLGERPRQPAGANSYDSDFILSIEEALERYARARLPPYFSHIDQAAIDAAREERCWRQEAKRQ